MSGVAQRAGRMHRWGTGGERPLLVQLRLPSWTGDESMTGAQRSYLDTLAREAGETLPADLTKAGASKHIERLQSQTGRGDVEG